MAAIVSSSNSRSSSHIIRLRASSSTSSGERKRPAFTCSSMNFANSGLVSWSCMIGIIPHLSAGQSPELLADLLLHKLKHPPSSHIAHVQLPIRIFLVRVRLVVIGPHDPLRLADGLCNVH